MHTHDVGLSCACVCEPRTGCRFLTTHAVVPPPDLPLFHTTCRGLAYIVAQVLGATVGSSLHVRLSKCTQKI